MKDVLKALKAFQEKYDLENSTVGRSLMNDPNLMQTLIDGRTVRRATRTKIMQRIAEYVKNKRK